MSLILRSSLKVGEEVSVGDFMTLCVTVFPVGCHVHSPRSPFRRVSFATSRRRCSETTPMRYREMTFGIGCCL